MELEFEATPKTRATRLWMPKQVLFTPAALAEPWGQQIHERIKHLGLPITELTSNRVMGLRGATERETYALAKRTLAVVVVPPSAFKLQPIPPSADWQFHLAEGCPAHCQYCYLAGSLSGPPVVRAFANLPAILDNALRYAATSEASFEVSCYTDPLSLEHLTGSLGECIRRFGQQEHGYLRWVSKFAAVEPLLNIQHNGRTRPRFSINAAPVSSRLEGGTASVSERLAAARRLATPRTDGGGGYPLGLVIAPIMPFADWQTHYAALLDEAASALDFACDLTFELITHRFTPSSKKILLGWYPNTSLDLDETTRAVKRNKFGGTKYVYERATMRELREFFEREIAARFPQAQILYWT